MLIKFQALQKKSPQNYFKKVKSEEDVPKKILFTSREKAANYGWIEICNNN